MDGSIKYYTGNNITNKPKTMKDYMNSEEAQENLYNHLKELTKKEEDVPSN